MEKRFQIGWRSAGYGVTQLRRDLVAGVTVAAVAVPQAMAYAQIAGVRPEYALYTAIVPAFLGSLLGSSSHLIYGPTNALSLVVFSALAGLPDGPGRPDALFVLALLVGTIQILLALLKLGDLTRYVSESVLLGFLTGAAILVALGQVENLLGLARPGGEYHILQRVWLALRYGGPVNGRALAVGVLSLLLVISLARLSRWLRFEIPGLLIAVLAASGAVWAFGWDGAGARPLVPVVGWVPGRLPRPQVPFADTDLLRPLSGSALALALLGLMESLAIAKGLAARTRQRLDYNRQCLAEGLANVSGGFFRCMPGGGSITRSAINFHAGAATRVSGMVSAVAVAGVLVSFAPLARYVPRAALAAILMVTAWRLVDRRQLLYCLRATRSDAATALVTAAAAVLISIEFSIFIGVFLSFLFFVPRAARLQAHELVVAPGRVLRERQPGDPVCTRLAIVSLEGEMFFGASPELEEHLDELARRADQGIRIIVLRLKRARNPDVVCIERLHRFAEDMHARGVAVLFCGVRPDMAAVLANVRSHEWLPPEHLFLEEPTVGSSTLHAVRFAYGLLGNDRCPTCPRAGSAEEAGPGWHYEV